tara:strand:- start:1101 stop:1358 length:258 start_codon:yes stop_codon:yes gene_type:complete
MMNRKDWSQVVDRFPAALIWIVTGIFLQFNASFFAVDVFAEGTTGELVSLNLVIIGTVLTAIGVLLPPYKALQLALNTPEVDDEE